MYGSHSFHSSSIHPTLCLAVQKLSFLASLSGPFGESEQCVVRRCVTKMSSHSHSQKWLMMAW